MMNREKKRRKNNFSAVANVTTVEFLTHPSRNQPIQNSFSTIINCSLAGAFKALSTTQNRHQQPKTHNNKAENDRRPETRRRRSYMPHLNR